MRRAMHFIETGNPQEGTFYDHPYMGQILLGTFLEISNYQNSSISTEPQSLENLYWLPRIFVGILAMIDTLLIYKIAQMKFNHKIALIAALLFSVMPFTWIFRRILLDSMLMPFLLGSILLAMYYGNSNGKRWLIPLSGVLLGIAIFTKIPVITFIPLVAWIVYQKQRKILDIFLVVIPSSMIPLMWPLNSLLSGHSDLFLKDVFWQIQRESSIFGITKFFLLIDPMLFVLGVCGIGYCIILKNKFVLFWAMPFFAFISLVGFKQYFHWIPLIPLFCMCGSFFIVSLCEKIKHNKIKTLIPASIIISGLIITGFVITQDASSSQFAALSYAIKNNSNETILASPVYSWVLEYFYNFQNTPNDYSYILYHPIEPKEFTMISDSHFLLDRTRGKNIQLVYDNSIPVVVFESNMNDNLIYGVSNFRFAIESSYIEIRHGVWES